VITNTVILGTIALILPPIAFAAGVVLGAWLTRRGVEIGRGTFQR